MPEPDSEDVMSFNCSCGANFESLYLLLHHMWGDSHYGYHNQSYPKMKMLVRQAKERKL